MRATTCVLPSSTNRQIEASNMYTEALQKLKDMKQTLHLTFQQDEHGAPSRADIKSLLGSDNPFFTLEYIKHGKRHVTAILSDDKKVHKDTK